MEGQKNPVTEGWNFKMYMLDTNILIFCIRHPDSQCARTLAEHVRKKACISVVTYAELEFGIHNSKYPDKNRIAINSILAGILIENFDMKAATHFGNQYKGMRKIHWMAHFIRYQNRIVIASHLGSSKHLGIPASFFSYDT